MVLTGELAVPTSAPASHLTPRLIPTTLPWSATVLTTDRLILVTLEVDPNRTGINSFTVKLAAIGSGRAITNASISMFTTMLDMKMATTSLVLHPDGSGSFHGKGELAMGGDWEIRFLIRIANQSQQEAQIRLLTPV
jgi:hypothetical protein